MKKMHSKSEENRVAAQLGVSRFPGDYENPDWGRCEKVHDWKNHVGNRTIALWNTLSADQKFAIAMDAQEEADNEDWE